MKSFNDLFVKTKSSMTLDEEISLIPLASESLIVIGRKLNEASMHIVEQAVLRDLQTIVITGPNLSTKHSRLLKKLMQQNLSENQNQYIEMMKIILRAVLSIIGIFMVLLIGSILWHFLGRPITDSNNVIRVFIPMLILFIALTLYSQIDKRIMKESYSNNKLEVVMIKKRLFKEKGTIIVLDDREVYLQLSPKEVYKSHKTKEFVDDMAHLIVKTKNLSKKEGIKNEEVLVKIYED